MDTKHDIYSIRLTASEIAELWSNYLSDSASICVFKYFKSKVVDVDIRSIVEYALSISETHIKIIKDILGSANHPLPYGFGEKDVNIAAEDYSPTHLCYII
jgi:hypothetical protein